jgi:transcriptional regulator with XRE-family HTH domain
MAFPDQLARLRKDKGLTQKELADKVELHQSQIHRYESGNSQPTLEALRRLALALGVSTDELVFEADERGPDDELRLQFEAVSRFGPDEKKTAKEVLDGLILKHEAKRWASSPRRPPKVLHLWPPQTPPPDGARDALA